MKKFTFLIVLLGIFLVFLVSNTNAIYCSGRCESGVECNAAGNPSEGKMWSCDPVPNTQNEFRCAEVDINAGGNRCYLDCQTSWQPCGCDVAGCQSRCLQQYAGQPGHHSRTEICSNCGQKFTCGCDIAQPPPPPQPRCGDGIVNQASEECDDGNLNNNDGCLNTCKIAKCGDNYIWAGREQCELPNTNNNLNCLQTTETCSGKKTGTRDAYGSCNSNCGCVLDSFNYQCIKGKCGAECSINSDCNDNNPKTQDICNSDCGCEHTVICVDECSLGETKCIGNKIYECGDFDPDPCLEWNFKKDCYYTKESSINYECKNEDSIAFKYIEEGFCKDIFGNKDYCDSKTTKIIVSTEDCGLSKCIKNDECKQDNIFEIEKCTLKGCNINNGKCYSSEETNIKLKESCGPDTCISFTEKDIYQQEYVDDFESCIEGNSYCNLDPGRIYDVCIDDKILNQVFCQNSDHSFEQFDCSSLSGCYEFTYNQCVYCPDDFGNCYKTDCERKGKEYRQYSCSSGKCSYAILPSIDTDNDKIDDRCDSCIDVDKDGVCDDKDNCVGVKNPNQIDKDNDGIGDECDNDRDGDGYLSDIDCNDWNPKINPGMKEILNNNIDDDCNPETKDRIADTPREVIYVDIQTNEDIYNLKNDDFIVLVSLTNNGADTLKNIQISSSFPNLQLNSVKLIRELKKGDTIVRLFTFTIPKTKETYEYLRVSITANDYKRTVYREIKLK